MLTNPVKRIIISFAIIPLQIAVPGINIFAI